MGKDKKLKELVKFGMNCFSREFDYNVCKICPFRDTASAPDGVKLSYDNSDYAEKEDYVECFVWLGYELTKAVEEITQGLDNK